MSQRRALDPFRGHLVRLVADVESAALSHGRATRMVNKAASYIGTTMAVPPLVKELASSIKEI